MRSRFRTSSTSATILTPFDNPDAKLIGIKGFDLIRHEHDKRSDHSALAYYQESTGTLVLGHRGSATAKDWLMTDVAIAFNAKQTKADLAAIKFADSVIWDLNRDEKPVNTVIETGHSKGGRESQTEIFAKKPFLRQPKPQTQVFGCFRPQITPDFTQIPP